MALRHEWKHRIDTAGLLALRARLGAVLQRDPHALGGSYQVRSLYFDNLADKALREKLESVNHREKFRLGSTTGTFPCLCWRKRQRQTACAGRPRRPLQWRKPGLCWRAATRSLGTPLPCWGNCAGR